MVKLSRSLGDQSELLTLCLDVLIWSETESIWVTYISCEVIARANDHAFWLSHERTFMRSLATMVKDSGMGSRG